MSRSPALPTPTTDLERLRSDIDRHGCCLIPDALDVQTLTEARARIVEQADAERAASVDYQNPGHLDNQWVNMLINKGEVFTRLVMHPLTSQVVAHVLGPDYLLSCCDAQIKYPGSACMPLHTDQWWMPQPSSPSDPPVRPAGMLRGDGTATDPSPAAAMIAGPATANVMWMITDFTTSNGATVVVPGSHLSGRQPDAHVPHRIETLSVVGSAGTAIVFDGRLWHAAGHNCTESTRYGITCNFCGPQFRTLENYTRGLRPEVAECASPELMRLLGFKAWSTYGHTGDPSVDCALAGVDTLGEMGSDK